MCRTQETPPRDARRRRVRGTVCVDQECLIRVRNSERGAVGSQVLLPCANRTRHAYGDAPVPERRTGPLLST
jgi:hypothetical protein